MKTGLSKREKVLIFVALAALLIFAGFQYVIQPLYNLYSERIDEHNLLSIEEMKLNLILASERIIHGSYEHAESRFKEIEKEYPEVMPNEEIDRVLTGLCLQNNLNPSALKISDAVDFFPPVEKPAEGEQDAENAENPPVEEQRSAAFVTVDAAMVLSGDYRSLKRLIDASEKIDYIRIKRVSLLYNQDEEDVVADDIAALFEITMRRNPS